MPEHEYIIKADVSNAEAGLNKLNKKFEETTKTATAAGNALSKNASKGADSAALALGNLGRVAQDAPFGFMAIQNNLNPMLESFQRASKEAGGFSASLKNMALALAGPVGVGLALSVVSSLLIKYPNLLSNVSAETLQAAKRQKEYTDAMASAQGALQTELTRMSALIQVARDVGQSTQTRTNAIKELQKEYPGYLSNLSLENINSEAAAKALDQLTAALTRKAKAQAISNLLTKAQEDLFKAQNAPLTEQISLLEGLRANFFGFGSLVESSQRAVEKATQNRGKVVQEIQKTITALSNELAALIEGQAISGDFTKLTTKIQTGVTKALRQVFPEGELTFIPFPIKIDLPVDVQLKETGSLKAGLDAFMNDLKRQAERAAAEIAESIESIGFKLPENFFNMTPEQQKELQETFKGISQTVETAITDMFVSIGENLGNMQNPFGALFEILGVALQTLGKYIIITSTLVSQITKALNKALSGSPFAGIAVGIGLIALGQILKNIPKFAEGGLVTGPTLGLVGEAGPEVIFPLDRIRDFMNPGGSAANVVVTGVLRGQDIYLQQQRVTRSNRRIF